MKLIYESHNWLINLILTMVRALDVVFELNELSFITYVQASLVLKTNKPEQAMVKPEQLALLNNT